MTRLRLALVVALAACEPSAPTPLKGRQLAAVKALGFTDAMSKGTEFFACAESDSPFESESFTAKNAQGQLVNGAVCCGLMLKGCTVRFE